jgi:ATP phosphoribosyltransferase regulatory subunit
LSVLAGLTAEQDTMAQAILQRKSLPEWQSWCASLTTVSENIKAALFVLPQLCGDGLAVLNLAEKQLSSLSRNIEAALVRLKHIVNHLAMTHQSLCMHLDLSDLRGFQYHTGVVFGVIESSRQRMIASGGRYDESATDTARAATGFSLDLRQLMDLQLPGVPLKRKRILAPAVADMRLVGVIQQLRQEGHSVLIGFPDVDWASQRKECDVELVKEHDHWVVR